MSAPGSESRRRERSMTGTVITVVLAEDHHVVRQGLRNVIETESDLEVVAEAADGVEALDAIERLAPHVLVTDLTMPKMGGLELTREVRRSHPATHVIILSIHSSTPYVQDAFASGALGYVLKSARADDFVDGIRRVAAGEQYLKTPVSPPGMRGREGMDEIPIDVLTPREREVLLLAAEGWTNAAAGARLGISPRTVEVHRAHVTRKLQLRSHTDLVLYALRHGVLRAE